LPQPSNEAALISRSGLMAGAAALSIELRSPETTNRNFGGRSPPFSSRPFQRVSIRSFPIECSLFRTRCASSAYHPVQLGTRIRGLQRVQASCRNR
jgi:hypothetical protein